MHNRLRPTLRHSVATEGRGTGWQCDDPHDSLQWEQVYNEPRIGQIVSATNGAGSTYQSRRSPPPIVAKRILRRPPVAAVRIKVVLLDNARCGGRFICSSCDAPAPE